MVSVLLQYVKVYLTSYRANEYIMISYFRFDDLLACFVLYGSISLSICMFLTLPYFRPLAHSSETYKMQRLIARVNDVKLHSSYLVI